MADTIATAYVKIEPTFDGVANKLKAGLGDESEKGGKEAGGKFGAGFASVLGTTAKVAAGAVAAGATAAAGIVKSATESYAQFEQLAGGTELLFGRTAEETEALKQSMLDSGMSAKQVADELANMSDASDIVMQNAESAFQRVQMSTNDYLQQANSFATGLKESLGGDSEAAANLADAIIVAQADVVAATGNNAENVANAFAGIMKNNFTMLDNLQLGIKPTKEGMQEVIDKMNELNGTEYEMGNLADMQSAIVDYIDYVGMAGYAQNEASETIEGSLATLKASWENLLTGMGNNDADMTALIDNLVGSAETFLQNVMPIAEQALTGISTLVADLAPVLAEKLPSLLQSVLPMLLTSGVEIIQTLGQGILSAIPTLMPTITDLIIQLSNMLIEMLPQLIEIGLQVIVNLALGIAQALPELVPTIIDVILSIQLYLLENIDILIDAAGQLIIGLAVGLVNAIPILIEKVPLILEALGRAFITFGAKLIEVGKQLIEIIRGALDTYGPMLEAKAQQLMADLKAKMLEKVKGFLDIGKNIVEGIKKGISDAWDALVNWFNDKIDGLVGGIKDLLGIESPSKVFAEDVGRWIPAGIAEGIKSGMGVLDSEINAMTGDMIQTAVNPTVMSTYTPVTTDDSDPIIELTRLLRTYLPQIAEGGDVNVTLEGGADRIFRAVQSRALQYKQTTGQNAFA